MDDGNNNILVVITISQLTESGLFEKAKLAKEKHENSKNIEDAILAEYENKIIDASRKSELANLTKGTASKEDIIEGKTAWVNRCGTNILYRQIYNIVYENLKLYKKHLQN